MDNILSQIESRGYFEQPLADGAGKMALHFDLRGRLSMMGFWDNEGNSVSALGYFPTGELASVSEGGHPIRLYELIKEDDGSGLTHRVSFHKFKDPDGVEWVEYVGVGKWPSSDVVVTFSSGGIIPNVWMAEVVVKKIEFLGTDDSYGMDFIEFFTHVPRAVLKKKETVGPTITFTNFFDTGVTSSILINYPHRIGDGSDFPPPQNLTATLRFWPDGVKRLERRLDGSTFEFNRQGFLEKCTIGGGTWFFDTSALLEPQAKEASVEAACVSALESAFGDGSVTRTK